MIVKKHEIESLSKGIDKLRKFYAHKYESHHSKINFIIQGSAIFVMVDKVHKETITEIKELKTI